MRTVSTVFLRGNYVSFLDYPKISWNSSLWPKLQHLTIIGFHLVLDGALSGSPIRCLYLDTGIIPSAQFVQILQACPQIQQLKLILPTHSIEDVHLDDELSLPFLEKLELDFIPSFLANNVVYPKLRDLRLKPFDAFFVNPQRLQDFCERMSQNSSIRALFWQITRTYDYSGQETVASMKLLASVTTLVIWSEDRLSVEVPIQGLLHLADSIYPMCTTIQIQGVEPPDEADLIMLVERRVEVHETNPIISKFDTLYHDFDISEETTEILTSLGLKMIRQYSLLSGAW